MATQWIRRWLLLTSLLPAVLLSVVLLTGCGAHMHHVVEPGETLYSIGFLYGYDYRKIAQWNGIRPPYGLNAGQVLRVAPPEVGTPPPGVRSKPPRRKPAPVVDSVKAGPRAVDRAGTPAVTPIAPLPITRPSVGFPKNPQWRWPVKSRKVLQTFSANDPGRKGLDIAGRRGDPVHAAAAGRVVYAGSGLVRYGQLIIIKHNEKYLSAYAHNDKLRVKEGDVIGAGQRIADMGSSGARRPMLHFEIRRNGKPVNPLRYLPQR
ncbi:MAG TPA: LysM peptidoglycan-binding domain-containing protein [Gammaproteobacteria bacterium]|nr:LysM peptidoglycan-binding domain-containing protein [Gammaproteobacteria bacterium]